MAKGWSEQDVTNRKNNKKKWTIMVYFAGDNNLSEEMIYAIKEMYRVGVTSEFDVIVQFDPSAIGAPVRRYVISQEELAKDVTIPEIKAALEAVSTEKAMVASASHSKVLGVSRFTREPCKEHEHGDRTTDSIGGLDIDSNIIETLGIPLDGKSDSPKSTRTASVRPFSLKGTSKGVPERLNFENSADPEVLEQFITESIDYFPSRHYMLVLSGHGNGALGDFLPDVNSMTKLPITSLSIPRLRKVFEKVKQKIDILGMDSCLMSMAEVGHELNGYVDYLVGSEGFVLNTGWPYHRVLEALNLNSTKLTPLELAKEIVRKYISYYDDYEAAGASTDQSVCDLGQLPQLALKIKILAQALTEALGKPALKDAIVLAHWEAQSYKAEQYTDLYDFCDRLQLHCIEHLREQEPRIFEALQMAKDDTEILQKTNEVLTALPKEEDAKGALQVMLKLIKTCVEVKVGIESRVVSLSCYTGPAFQHSHGLSVYFPWTKSDDLDAYINLTFNEKTGWGTFLKEYVDKTLRPERPHIGKKRKGHFNPNPNNEIVETLLLVRHGVSGNPRGSSSIGSTKNPPTDWHRGKCG